MLAQLRPESKWQHAESRDYVTRQAEVATEVLRNQAADLEVGEGYCPQRL